MSPLAEFQEEQDLVGYVLQRNTSLGHHFVTHDLVVLGDKGYTGSLVSSELQQWRRRRVGGG